MFVCEGALSLSDPTQQRLPQPPPPSLQFMGGVEGVRGRHGIQVCASTLQRLYPRVQGLILLPQDPGGIYHHHIWPDPIWIYLLFLRLLWFPNVCGVVWCDFCIENVVVLVQSDVGVVMRGAVVDLSIRCPCVFRGCPGVSMWRLKQFWGFGPMTKKIYIFFEFWRSSMSSLH